MIAFFGSLIIGLAVAYLVILVSRRFFEESRKVSYVRAITIGLIVMFSNYMAIKAPAFVAVFIMMPLVIATMAYIIYWWGEEGSSVKEFLIFLLINIVLAIVLNNEAVRMRDITTIRWVISLFESLGFVSVIMSVGFLLADIVWFREDVLQDGLFSKKGGDHNEKDHES